MEDEWLTKLAAGHELTGGQWRNVVYRAFIEEALGHELSLEMLQKLAASEGGGGKKKNSLPIGFLNGLRQVA